MDFKAEAVCKMQDYIRANFTDSISLSALAQTCGYSPWHAYRLFLYYTGYSPAEYIRKVRLSASALRLRDERIKVIDAALDAGFSAPESFTRAFCKEFGLNPKEFSLKPVMIPLFHPFTAGISKRSKKKLKETNNIFITLVEKSAHKVILKRGIKAKDYFTYYEEVECDLWGKLLSLKSIAREPVSMWLPKRLIKPGTSEYVQGVEVAADYNGEIPDGFDLIELESAQYLMFQGEPFKDEEYCEAIEALWNARSKYDPAILGFAWDSENPRIQLEPIGGRGYIELFPVKACQEGLDRRKANDA